jgi:hypothetical protein
VRSTYHNEELQYHAGPEPPCLNALDVRGGRPRLAVDQEDPFMVSFPCDLQCPRSSFCERCLGCSGEEPAARTSTSPNALTYRSGGIALAANAYLSPAERH